MKTKLHPFGTVLVAASTLLLAASVSDASTLHFNGSSAYVTAGAHPGLKVTGTNLTLEAWIKPTGRGSDASGGGVILGREGEYMIARYADGYLQYAFATAGHPFSFEDTGYYAPANQWTHVALTYDGARVRFYVNGEYWSPYTASGPITDLYPAEEDFRIGGRQHQAQYFQGQIDDVRVWNTNRSQAEISANMTRPLQGNEPGLLGYYRFEEGFGTTTADASGRGRTGTLVGGPVWDGASQAPQVPVPLTQPAALVTETTARLNARVSTNGILATNAFWLATNASTALTFDGINDSVSFSLGPNYQYNAYPLTVTAWIKTAGPGGSGGIVNKYTMGSLNGWQLHLINGQLRAFYFRNGSANVWGGGEGLNGGNVDDGQWHHTAFTVSTNAAIGGRLYVDGVLTATNAWTGAPGACTTTQPLRFGAYGTVYFAGQIDDVTLWNTELAATNIASLMTNPPTPAHPQYASLVAHWPLNERSGAFVNDATGRNPAGMLVGEPQWVSQARPDAYVATPLLPVRGTNSVLDLDGVDDHVRVPAGIWFNNEFTIETWVFARSFNSWERIIDFGNGAPSDNVLFAVSEGTTGRPAFQVIRGAASAGLIEAPDPIPLGEWVHVAATLRNNVATLFVNGVATVSGTVTAPNAVNRNNNFIGRSAWAPDAYANVLYDDLRIWNVARTPAQIRQFMTEAVSPSDPNLLLNYRFDDPPGLTVVDSRTTSPQNGTLTNGASRLPFERMSLDVSGLTPGTRYHYLSTATSTNGTEYGPSESFATPAPAAGTALEFDGTNDSVRIAGFGASMPTTNVTVEFWQRVHSMKAQSTFSLEADQTANRFQAHVPWLDGTVYWDFGNVGGSGRLSYIPPESIVGTWQHFAMVSSVSGNFMRIYRNGVLEASKTGAGNFTRGQYDLLLGKSSLSGQFDGELDEFRVWKVARTDTEILRDFNRRLVLPLPMAHVDVLDFTSAPIGLFTTLVQGEYVLNWAGFGDQLKVVNVGGANGNVLKDAIVNMSGAGVSIARTDGRPFYFQSFDAAGIAVGSDRIDIIYPAELGNPQVVQSIRPTTTGFATYNASLPNRLVTHIWLGIVSTSTDMAVDNVRLGTDGLVAYYRMDEGAGSVVVDATGGGKDGLLLGTNSPTWIPSTAPVGWPLVTTSEVSDIVLGDVTLEATVKGDASSDTRTWIEFGQYVPVPGTANNIAYLYYGVPTVPIPVSTLSQVNFDAAPYAVYGFSTIDFNTGAGRYPPWGYWEYYAARYVGRIFVPAAGTYTFYVASDDGSQLFVDGQLVVTNDGIHGPIERGVSTNLAAGYHWLEARMFNNAGAATLIVSYAGPGIPKQVIPATAFQRHEAVFTGRTPAQTNALAAGFQDFSAMATNIGGSGNYVFRVVAANAAGTNYGPAQPVVMGTPGAFTALFFNGLGAHVEVPGGTNFLAFPGNDAFTLEAWVNPATLGATQVVVSKYSHPSQREYFLALNGSGQVVFNRQGSDFATTAVLPVGQYTHVAASYDGTLRRIYLNGQLASGTDPGSGAITNWNAPFLIGARYWSNSVADFFQGTIDDVRVWQVARSQVQITGDMNRRLSGFELGLAAYYRFDEAQGGFAEDSTVHENVGILRNAPVFVPGGLQFACTSAPPVLNIELLDFAPGVIIWWPITCNEYILEEAATPGAPPEAWYPVFEPVTPVGDSYLMVFLWDRWNDGFFRLRRL